MNIIQTPASPHNYTPGRAGHRPQRIVIHVMDGSLSGTGSWFADPASNVSAHYGIGSAGQVVQYVQEADTAWQAGDFRVNQTTIGVEHEGRPAAGPWAPTEAQLQASAALVADICKRYGILPGENTIIPHSQINPQHRCPGPTWPWSRYLALVVGLVNPQPAHVATPADKQPLRLFDPATNQQVGLASLIVGTNKAYIVPSK